MNPEIKAVCEIEDPKMLFRDCTMHVLDTGARKMALYHSKSAGKAFLAWADTGKASTRHSLIVNGETHKFVCFCNGNGCRIEKVCFPGEAPTEYKNGFLTDEYIQFRKEARAKLTHEIESVCRKEEISLVVVREPRDLSVPTLDIEDWKYDVFCGAQKAETEVGSGI